MHIYVNIYIHTVTRIYRPEFMFCMFIALFFMGQVYKLDLNSLTWDVYDTRGPSLTQHTAVAYASDIYIFGGRSRDDAMQGYSREFWQFKVVEREWVKLGPPDNEQQISPYVLILCVYV